MSESELDSQEKRAFMEWRRSIAEREEKATGTLVFTPYEKNLEVWRQL